MVVRREWQAAIAYALVLMLVVNVHFLGLADYIFYGINISVYSLAAYIIYCLYLVSGRDEFLRQHLYTSVSAFLVYFILSSLYSGMMYILGYQVSVISWGLLAKASFATWVAVGPLLAILAHAMMSAVHGIRVSLQGRDPDGRPYGG